MSRFLDTVVTNPLHATAITYAKNTIFAQVFMQILNHLQAIAQIILRAGWSVSRALSSLPNVALIWLICKGSPPETDTYLYRYCSTIRGRLPRVFWQRKKCKKRKKVLTNGLRSGILTKLSVPDGCGAGLQKKLTNFVKNKLTRWQTCANIMTVPLGTCTL